MGELLTDMWEEPNRVFHTCRLEDDHEGSTPGDCGACAAERADEDRPPETRWDNEKTIMREL